jgi:hypothetical protein
MRALTARIRPSQSMVNRHKSSVYGTMGDGNPNSLANWIWVNLFEKEQKLKEKFTIRDHRD